MLTPTTNSAQSAPPAEREPETCPQCGERPITKFVSVPDYGFGGDPAFGSFRAGRCAECTELLRRLPAFAGMRFDVSDYIITVIA